MVDTLYRKGLDSTLIRCLEKDESRVTLQEVHIGICGSHSSGFTLAKKILRMGYFWPTMEKDSIDFVKTCKKCQIHGNLVHTPAQEINPLVMSWPFYQWGFDLIEAIHPPSSSEYKWIITTTEYFTKWVKAVQLADSMGKKISSFILNHIIFHFGIPHAILTNNALYFKNQIID